MQKESFELKTQKVKRICNGKEEAGEDRETFEQQQREKGFSGGASGKEPNFERET